MKLEELEVYNLSMEIGEKVWAIVGKWEWFERDTVGKQWVRAADSMAANLSEGFGRFHYKENKQYGYYSRGSLFETRTWLTKAHHRQLVTDDEYETLLRTLNTVGVKLNNYIKSIGPHETVGQVKEDQGAYQTEPNDNE